MQSGRCELPGINEGSDCTPPTQAIRRTGRMHIVLRVFDVYLFDMCVFHV